MIRTKKESNTIEWFQVASQGMALKLKCVAKSVAFVQVECIFSIFC